MITPAKVNIGIATSGNDCENADRRCGKIVSGRPR